MSLKYRLLLIAGLVLVSAWALFPRTVVERVRRSQGIVYDTVRRVPLKRGLDLQGGMHLTLEVDDSKGPIANKSEALDRALKVVRTRIDQFGVAEPVVQKVGDDRIIVELPGIDDPERAEAVVQKSAFLQFQITDKTQALERVLPRLDAAVKSAGGAQLVGTPGTSRSDTGTASAAGLEALFTADTTNVARDSARPDTARPDVARRDTALRDTARSGSTGPDAATAAGSQDTTLPGQSGGPFSKLIAPGGSPGEYYVAETDFPIMERYLEMPQVQAALPPGKVLRWGSDTTTLGNNSYRPLYVLDARPIITGEYITDAKPNQIPTEGTVVEFELNNVGGRRFRAETSKHIKDYMAIVLDDRVMGRPPVIQSAIGTRGQITMGGRDLQEAQDLALVLRAGALPVPLKVAEVRSIGASLGRDSVQKGIQAGLLAVALVVLIMVIYYRWSGVLSIAGMSLYVLFTLAVLAGFGAVLTLPGLAGFVLSIGMAVDANVLIFERIREELDAGKSVRTAVDEGFPHAMSAIVDSNVTAALTAAVLYQYGTGPVQGFAVTLLAGIAASMFTEIFVVRTFFMLWLSRRRSAQPISI